MLEIIKCILICFINGFGYGLYKIYQVGLMNKRVETLKGYSVNVIYVSLISDDRY